MSTSSFDIINDNNLRNLLISWNEFVEDYQEEEEEEEEEEEKNSRYYV
jgi:hypothetical protein